MEIVGTKSKLLLEDYQRKLWKYKNDIEEYSKPPIVTDSKELKIELTKEEFEEESEPYMHLL